MFYIIIVFLVFIDLITKKIAFWELELPHNIIGDFFYLKYVENPGIAFSIPLTGIILKIITIVFIIAIFYYYFTEEKKKNNYLVDTSFAFILGGAIGNGYERVFNGKVIDFLGVKYFSVFNLADVFITIGVFLYLLYLFLDYKNKQK